MATGLNRVQGESRRFPPSSSHSSRFDSTRTLSPPVLCRNGPQCRKYQEGVCNFSHDFATMTPTALMNAKRSLNADSPAFSPKLPDVQPAKIVGISPKIAAAAAFSPRASNATISTAYTHSKEPSVEFVPGPTSHTQILFNEFVPGTNFVQQQQQDDDQTSAATSLTGYSDPFLSQQIQQSISGNDAHAQINPYAHGSTSTSAQGYFSEASAYHHPLNYHLYAAIGPKREIQHPYQRSTSDFFIADDLRETLQKQSEAALQTFANTSLPQNVEYFHSLVSLDTNPQKDTVMFGYATTIYKAVSAKDGRIYALRRVEGFRLKNEAAVRSFLPWKRINNASIVKVYDVFTGRWFGDSSLMIVTDYHPLSKTLAEKSHTATKHAPNHRVSFQGVPEQELWGYIVQLSNAIRAIHDAGLAARCIKPSKILVTSKNRLRLNCCGLLDILMFDQQRNIQDLQYADLEDLGRLILGLAARNTLAYQNIDKARQLLAQNYSERFRACINWLLSPPATGGHLNSGEVPAAPYTIGTLLGEIADQVLSVMDSGLHQEDAQQSELMRELENARLVRLLAKLNTILERPDTSLTRIGTATPTTTLSQNHSLIAWSDTGDRYYLKLFRDYVFHQVDAESRPVLDLGHIMGCINKLDSGVDEKVQLLSRDENNVFIMSYRELKRGLDAAWAEITKAAANNARR